LPDAFGHSTLVSTMHESIRLGDGDEDHKTMSLLMARELTCRQVDPLPFLVAAKLLDVPE